MSLSDDERTEVGHILRNLAQKITGLKLDLDKIWNIIKKEDTDGQ